MKEQNKMKKLMIAAAIVCAAAFAQAGAINWATGVLYTPSADGSIGSDATGSWVFNDKITSASGYTLKMYAWESLTASDVAFTDASKLLQWYTDGASKTADPFGGSLAAINGTVTMNANIAQATATGAELTTTGGTSVYGSILLILEDSTTGDPAWYMVNSGSASAKAGTSKGSLASLGSLVGGTGGTDHTMWQSVPEPTSGLLLLLGVAGLALRRRRA